MGVGFAKDGEGAVRNNRNLQLSQREKYFKKQKHNLKKTASLHYRSATKEELQKIRVKLRKQKKRDKQITIVVLLIFLLLTAYFL
jgi:hypothetical protein